MDYRTFRKFVANRFMHLLAMLIILFLSFPLLREEILQFPLRSVGFLFAIVLMLRAVYLSRRAFIISVAIVGAACLIDIIVYFGHVTVLQGYTHVLTLVTYAVFVAMTSMFLLKELLRDTRVTQDTIMGGVCLYFNLGFLWAICYALIDYFDPGAFTFSPNLGFFHPIYFSFTTLTTLGYGDILPQKSFPMMLSSLEAMVGQIYLAVFVARLVALHVSSHYIPEKREL